MPPSALPASGSTPPHPGFSLNKAPFTQGKSGQIKPNQGKQIFQSQQAEPTSILAPASWESARRLPSCHPPDDFVTRGTLRTHEEREAFPRIPDTHYDNEPRFDVG